MHTYDTQPYYEWWGQAGAIRPPGSSYAFKRKPFELLSSILWFLTIHWKHCTKILNVFFLRRGVPRISFSDMRKGEWGTFCHFFPSLALLHTLSTAGVSSLVYSLQQELEMSHWCFGCISIRFDVRVGYLSMRHLTEPAPYTGQILSSAGAHSVSDGTHPFITARHPVSLECLIPVCSINPRQLQYIKNDHQVWFWHRIFSRLVLCVSNILRHLQGKWD